MFKATVAAIAALGVYMTQAPMSTAQADEIADFYSGKTVTIYIGYGFGGTYGKYSRLMAEHLPRFIPGKPKMIVKSMPGAGGLKMVNYAGQAMQKTGYSMLVPVDTLVVSQLLRPNKVRYNAADFTWIGSTNQTNTIFVLRKDSGIKTWQDLKTKQAIAGHTGPGSTAFLIPRMLKSMLNLKIKQIAGYKGSSKTILAMEQGEHQGSAFNWLAWNSKRPEWFKKETEFAVPIIQTGITPDPALPGLPMMRDVVEDKYKPILKFMASLGVIGRSLALPPGAPKKLVAPLRAAFDKMVKDPAYATAAKKVRLRVMATSGAEVQGHVNAAFASADPKTLAMAKKLIFDK